MKQKVSGEDIRLQILGLQIGLARLDASIRDSIAGGSMHSALSSALGPRRTRPSGRRARRRGMTRPSR